MSKSKIEKETAAPDVRPMEGLLIPDDHLESIMINMMELGVAWSHWTKEEREAAWERNRERRMAQSRRHFRYVDLAQGQTPDTQHETETITE